MKLFFIKVLLALPGGIVLNTAIQPESLVVSFCIGFVTYMFSDLCVNSWRRSDE